ncbi:IS3 family transposase [Virgibacillus chiguensis]|uniref:IS3 family transposase n=1 Tax=Virgibacillus chiguensis TaxID=411959 RepID=UPI0009FC63F3|nr:IS3 family transposase [Virgibacillus chiguensis]
MNKKITKITKRIVEIHEESGKHYGARQKSIISLKEEGYKVSLKRVQRLMQ